MPSIRRTALLLLAIAGMATEILVPTPIASAIPAPTGVFVMFDDSDATLYWTEVPGSQGYAVTIRPVGVQGPYGEEQVLGNRWTVPFTHFPGSGRYKKGYAYQVCSITKNNGRNCKTVNDKFYVRSQGDGVSTSNLRRAANKASSCLAAGERAALVAAASSGTVLAFVSWIPGVGEVTAGDVGIGAADAGVETFVACLAG